MLLHKPRPTNYHTKRVSTSFDTKTKEGKSRTIQADANYTDINKMLKRYNRTGVLPGSLNNQKLFYGDFDKVGDLTQTRIKIQQISDWFMTFPAETRRKFNNDPAQMCEWVENPKNIHEAIDLEIVPAPKGYKKRDVRHPESPSAVPEGQKDVKNAGKQQAT